MVVQVEQYASTTARSVRAVVHPLWQTLPRSARRMPPVQPVVTAPSHSDHFQAYSDDFARALPAVAGDAELDIAGGLAPRRSLEAQLPPSGTLNRLNCER